MSKLFCQGEDRDPMYERRLREQEPQQQHLQGQDAMRRLNDAIKKNQHSNQDPRTYCVDFDGVLAHHESGWAPDKIGNPLGPGIQMAKRIKAAGHRLVILTARPKEHHNTIEGWLKGHGVRADQVTNVKPPAEVYVDDRALAWPKNYGGQAHVFTSKRKRENGGDGIRNGLDGHRVIGSLDTGRTNRESSRYKKNGKKKSLKRRIAEGFYPEIR